MIKLNLKEVAAWLLIVATAALVVAGRVETLHLTEGEAFLAGWPYWLGAAFLALCAALVIRSYIHDPKA